LQAAIAPNQVWLSWEKVTGILQIPDTDIHWLVNTGQLSPKVVRNEMIFNSPDVWRLIDSYRSTQARRKH
jgi:hypothetical protein